MLYSAVYIYINNNICRIYIYIGSGMAFSDAIMDDRDLDEVIFVTPHVQPVFVPDSADDASYLNLMTCSDVDLHSIRSSAC